MDTFSHVMCSSTTYVRGRRFDSTIILIFQVLPDSQPLTPISASTPDHPDARTPQSVRSLDSEPMIPPSAPTVSVQGPVKAGRKRKNAKQTNVTANTGENLSGLHSTSHNHNHTTTHLSSPCAKRQIIVQNDVMDGTSGNVSSNHGHNGSLTAPVTPGSVGHDSASSPHHSEADNSGDSARWRKINHQPQSWDSSVTV